MRPLLLLSSSLLVGLLSDTPQDVLTPDAFLPCSAGAAEAAGEEGSNLAEKGATGNAVAQEAVSTSSVKAATEGTNGSWFSSFMEHLAYAAAAQSAAASGIAVYPTLAPPLSPPAAIVAAPEAEASAVQAGTTAAPAEGWNWRDAVTAFFDKVERRLEEGGPALYAEVYDFTL
ncbi:uncharacterized protein LOC34618274 [Cyclospora cayetanensis]|uniref:Uncharacterized protein LOC34618274 n=1 Tax=Cyclospora cayetanensis TaxID=88456 RepID=A0A6P6RSB6_9EIME|nr:uncharacterized protein LOC34618274 [Cyclospora cayetanensis]